jgi:beta-glucanase (GH16 family)
MPAGSGNHPAFWMLGDNINQVGWPYSGEMDITEIHSNIPNETTAAINYSTSFAPNACCTNHNYVVEKLNSRISSRK